MVTSLSPLPLSFSFTLIPQAARPSDKPETARAESQGAGNLALATGHTSKSGCPVQAGTTGSDAGNADRQAAVNRDLSEERSHRAGFGNRSVREGAEIVLRVRKVGDEIGAAEGNHEGLIRGAGQNLLQEGAGGIGQANAGHELPLGHNTFAAGRADINRGDHCLRLVDSAQDLSRHGLCDALVHENDVSVWHAAAQLPFEDASPFEADIVR